MTELLAPAGDERSAYAALRAGADAVYLGLTRFSAREGAENFCISALEKLSREAHLLGAKVYVALNTLVKDEELPAFFAQAREAWNAGADAILLQDIFLGRKLKETYPEITLHLSTQAGCCNIYGAQLAKECGFSRVVLARETPIGDIPAIAQLIEAEAFVQGALCTCFSGQCYFSSFAGNNSGNRGRCKQPCRKKYTIDRAGFDAPAYALSLSDLSVGEDVQKLLDAGVVSLKIEGRMRSPAYVAAAVSYYRALLDGKPAGEAFSEMRRAYNRGDYTRGLAFGQDARLLSRDVQGHIGERIGEIVRAQGKAYLCKSDYAAEQGDGFKVLRGGKEVGGARFFAPARDGFLLTSPEKLRIGDEVRLTLCAKSEEHALALRRLRTVDVCVTLLAGQPMRAVCEGVGLEGEVCEAAKNAPLSEADVAANFSKVDALPFSPRVTVHTDGVFVPKSVLNAFRRAFYEKLYDALSPARAPLAERTPVVPVLLLAESAQTAAIVPAGFAANTDLVIEKLSDDQHTALTKGAWLYLPPLFTQADEALLASVLREAEGIYCEGTYGVFLAKKYGCKLFAGTGWNLSNRVAVAAALEVAEYVALSKELTVREQDALSAARTFVLSGGDCKLMDLCYCPFEKSCKTCDRRAVYHLTDEAGRAFPLRRYALVGGCRFEVYNCLPLAAGVGRAGALVDCSLGDKTVLKNVRDPAAVLPASTRGHGARSLL